ncbi:sigma-70 family RNA polymerase sigma factor [Candidatus Cyanaurora vandensis]|uniref:sigma-70 family RNA polymerase sigma factor n=1 Tax=Candidatus Cyanaurora vandensis TaxID=2714958 RepID=UPI00257BC7A4|nr:sigma-70 family RNA polymerase sigma factor [Candidatus Cyanaurora vandensis]
MQRREQLCANQLLLGLEQEHLLLQISQELLRAGLAEFYQLLARVCQVYFYQRKDRAHGFELDDFTLEVQLATLGRLSRFNPQVGKFSSWFGACILPSVYSSLQRQLNPTWGRPRPQTPLGLLVRREAFNVVNCLSLDQPLLLNDSDDLITLGNKVPQEATAETELLEQQCLELFVQALRQLRTSERNLLRSLYLGQQTQRSLADTLGITPAAMSMRLKKIYRRLATLLGESFAQECANTPFCEALGWIDLWADPP